ncbi:hypothetical protein [Laspinema olomoucense]|uniref:hypothetical protein n=1 Tax=Laspinema olomoucense TaxID=3231600 RepID=UPI0021BBB30A|nr:hypothetical protein [Laspinema sp. D3c]MCT7992409.1 hypothetical protein [Laspinema sp. D3c]
MDFPEFLKECAKNDELVSEFNRLNRCNLYHLDLNNPRDVKILDQFTDFVYNHIWLMVQNH